MKIAVLFRGPVRPQPYNVVERYREFMSQFINIDAEVTTYLATWRQWKNYKASDILGLDLFDNVIMQTEPTDAHRERCTALKKLQNGADIRPVYNMYYQSRTALDLIVNADNYDYIVHTRTDLQMIFGAHLPQWFNSSYTTIHAKPHPWTCDQMAIAPTKLMYNAWNYGTIEHLGRMIEAADKPEAVLEMMIEDSKVPVKTAPYDLWRLDHRRNM